MRASRWGLATAFILAASPAWADPAVPPSPRELPQRTAAIALEKQNVTISVAYRDVLDDKLRKRLLSGLPTTIIMRGFVLPVRGSSPTAMTVKSCHIVYDLWDEVFRIQIAESARGQSATVAVNIEGVLRRCTELRQTVLAPRSELTDRVDYFVAALVEVNPLSPELLDRIQRWVSQPKGGQPNPGASGALFGSFVGLFVPRVGDADRKLAFRTQAFHLEPAPPKAP